MTQAQRVEMWTALLGEAVVLAQDYVANLGLYPTSGVKGLDMRMSAARGQVRGLDFRLLPYPAWEDGRHFLWLMSTLLDEDGATAARIEVVDDLVVVARRLVATLAVSAHRPRADLDD